MVKHLNKYISITVLVIFVCNSGCSYSQIEKAEIYYTPFSVETYTPITKEDITCRSKHIYRFHSKENINQLEKILNGIQNNSFQKFDESRVRAKVVIGNSIYFIDGEGVVENNGKSNGEIDTETLKSFLKENSEHMKPWLESDHTCESDA